VSETSPGQRGSFAAVTALFFTMGFITSVIDPLIPSVKAVFKLNYAESMLTQFTYFLAYAFVSLPGGWLVAKLGYSKSIILALAAMTAGCLIMPAAANSDAYSLILLGLFVLASGVTVLQVTANPLAALIGPPERSHFRLTLSQAFNSLGTVIGPYFGTMIMLRGGVFSNASNAAEALTQKLESLRGIGASFEILAVMTLVLMVLLILFGRGLDRPTSKTTPEANRLPVRSSRCFWAYFGAAAIFLYVGAEVSVGSLMINFLHQSAIVNVTLETAGKLLALYWFGAMVGRFAGSAALTRYSAYQVLSFAALGATFLCFLVTQLAGTPAAVAALSIGFLNSIMFPTIFTLTLERSTATAAQTSGRLCTAIVGGAILPMSAGFLADAAGLRFAYLIPMAAYAFIMIFALMSARAPVLRGEIVPVATTGS